MEVEICDYELSLKLKKAGYNEWCRQYWCTSVRHNGEELGCDEEYELKAEGKGDEIEYIPGGKVQSHWNKNVDDDGGTYNEDTCSAPLINDVIDWLEAEKGIFVVPELVYGDDCPGIFPYKWRANIYTYTKDSGVMWNYVTMRFSKKADALSTGIDYVLENIMNK